MTIREEIISEINVLDESQLKKVADFLDVVKLKTKKTNKSKNGKPQDSLFNFGRNPIDTGVSDASENLDNYLY